MKSYPLKKKLIALLMIVSFSYAPIVFAQTDTSGSDAAATPAPDTSTASTVPAASTPASTDTSTAPAATSDPAAGATPAPDATASSTVTTPASAPSSPTDSGTVNPQDAGSITVQDTFNGQAAVTGDTLESTADPQTATSSAGSTAVLPVVSASSSDVTAATGGVQPIPITTAAAATAPASALASSTSTADVVAQNIDPNATSSSDALDPSAANASPMAHAAQILPTAPVSIPIAALIPSPQYAFAMTGTSIPTVAKSVNADGTPGQSSTVTTALTPAIDNSTGIMTVSGQCSAAYFVVLLFKNATDYADDPSSYLINKAYPCVSGTYTYSISQLPYNIADGTYYLMIGQEGNSGTWSPITGLSEITINRTH